MNKLNLMEETMKKLLNVLLVLTAVSAVAPAVAMNRAQRAEKRNQNRERTVTRVAEDVQVEANINARTAIVLATVGALTLATAYALYNGQVDCAQVALDYCAGTAAPAAVEACKAYLPYSCMLGV